MSGDGRGQSCRPPHACEAKEFCGVHAEEPAGREQAAERVRRFLDAWQSHASRTDHIYGLGVNREDETRDLLASDLRLLLPDDASRCLVTGAEHLTDCACRPTDDPRPTP